MKRHKPDKQRIDDLLDYLHKITAHFKPPMCPLERFVLDCGTNWEGAKRPKGLRKRADRQCFYNAASLSHGSGGRLRYVEGYGLHAFIPCLHAWCLDEDGRVIDLTWPFPEVAVYRGVVIPDQILVRSLVKNKCYGVLDPGIVDFKVIEELRALSKPSA